ncbi:poly-beta-1,6 N-acetyl-D-glucosamine synthase [compost metagenome]
MNAQTTAMPLVSVLMPVFNHARFLEQGLQSVLDDGWPNIELVAIDDGSSDNSFEVMQAWLRDHGHRFARAVVSRQENAGIVRTLNRLVQAATGEYVILLASDDQLLPGGIESRLRHLQAHPDSLAVFGDSIGIGDDGDLKCNSVIRDRFGGNTESLGDPQRLALELILNWSVPGPVLMARRDTYSVIGQYDESYFIEDRDYYLRLLARHALVFLDKPVAAYRMHAASISGDRTKQIRIGQEIVRIEKKLLPLFSGIESLALRVQMWANSSAFHTAPALKKPFVAARCLAARTFGKLMLQLVRAGSLRHRGI